MPKEKGKVQKLKNFSTKQLAITSLAIITLFAFAFSDAHAKYADGFESMVTETIAASLDCDTATFYMACSIASENMTLVHFPSSVNMNDEHLANCTSIIVMFTEASTVLTFVFNETSEGDAKTNADAMIPSMNVAFSLTFMHNSTTPYYTPYYYVVVIYTADGKSNMQTFLANLKTDCIDSTVDGFSDVLPTFFTHAESKTILFTATNASSTWYNMLIAQYNTTFPIGAGNHTIDILYYLGTGSLRPSDYAQFSGYYLSPVVLTINSSSTITFVSCQPPEASIPIYSVGWYVPEHGPANQITGTMYFANQPNIGELITFTFEGAVIPEFTALTSILTIMLISTIMLLLHRQQKIIH